MYTLLVSDVDPALSVEDIATELRPLGVFSVTRLYYGSVPAPEILLHFHSASTCNSVQTIGVVIQRRRHRVSPAPANISAQTPAPPATRLPPPYNPPPLPSPSCCLTTISPNISPTVPVPTTTTPTITVTSTQLYPIISITTTTSSHPSPLLTSLPLPPNSEQTSHQETSQPPSTEGTSTDPSENAAHPSSPLPPSDRTSTYSCVLRGMDPNVPPAAITRALRQAGVPVKQASRIYNSDGPTFLVRLQLPTHADVQRLIDQGIHIYGRYHRVEPSHSSPLPSHRMPTPRGRPRPVPSPQSPRPHLTTPPPLNYFTPPLPNPDLFTLILTSLLNFSSFYNLLALHLFRHTVM